MVVVATDPIPADGQHVEGTNQSLPSAHSRWDRLEWIFYKYRDVVYPVLVLGCDLGVDGDTYLE